MLVSPSYLYSDDGRAQILVMDLDKLGCSLGKRLIVCHNSSYHLTDTRDLITYCYCINNIVKTQLENKDWIRNSARNVDDKYNNFLAVITLNLKSAFPQVRRKLKLKTFIDKEASELKLKYFRSLTKCTTIVTELDKTSASLAKEYYRLKMLR